MSSLFKLLITLSLSAVLSTTVFAEKTHFNLASQQFSKTLKTSNNTMELARYNLPDAYATTNLLVRDGKLLFVSLPNSYLVTQCGNSISL